MRAAPAFGRKKCERRCPFLARSQAARNIPSVAGRFIFAEATVRRAHHSPDGSESRSAEATCGSFSIARSGGEIASKPYMLSKMRDIPVLCSVSTGARGQPTRTLLIRKFPHQVLILADNVRGRALDSISAFHDDAGVPIKSRSARKDDKWYRLYWFAERRCALSFQLKFGGELLDRSPPN
jgi:hypothetical protein